MKSILLIISGSVAAVRAYDLVRALVAAGHSVECVLTHAAQAFVTPMALTALTGNKTYTHLWDEEVEAEMGHIALSRRNDIVLVAPATAHLMAKMVHGLADDLASTLLLATNKPVIVVPAMNVEMWQNPATVRNVAQLKADGVQVIEPANGLLACGEVGKGRMAEVSEIVAALSIDEAEKALLGKKVLITAGATKEAIDPVRYISNHSSGKQGFAIADYLAKNGAEVTLVTGESNLPTPQGVKRIDVVSAEDMLKAVEAQLPVDVAIFAAAVSDWKVAEYSQQKRKKTALKDTLTLVQNPDILASIAQHKTKRPELVIGFAAETENLIQHATQKRAKKKCDWLLANDVSENVFGNENTNMIFITPSTMDNWGVISKALVAKKLSEEIVTHFKLTKREKKRAT